MIVFPELIVENASFSYHANGTLGICRIRIYQAETKYIIIATELAHNTGASITNAATELAREVLLTYPTLPLADEILFLEHYSARDSYGQKTFKKDTHTFDRVTFSVSSVHDGSRPIFTAAKWQRLSTGTEFNSLFLSILHNKQIIYSMIDCKQ